MLLRTFRLSALFFGGVLVACGGSSPGGMATDAASSDASHQDGGSGPGRDGGGPAHDGGGSTGTMDSQVQPPPGCGDGEIDPEDENAEACDDGNSESGDGCSPLCELEEGWLCPQKGGACAPNCGDGLLTGAEECDDANGADGDGCDARCVIEEGWGCPSAGEPCVAAACGDAIEAGDESCDDGNAIPGDGCDAGCQLEDGWLCVGQKCSAERCGDGFRAGTEQCDDGNTESGDGCLADCSGVEPFFSCPVTGGPCTKTTQCGDGIVTPDEGCDDFNLHDGDGCSRDCEVEVGWSCPGGRMCESDCGDGIVVGAEQCDDMGDAAPGCDDECNLEEGYHCPAEGAACEEAVCGNGIQEGLEQCDDGALAQDGVTPLPDHNLGDGCTPFCTREPVCSNGTCSSTCGDGIIGGDEACDDGNTRNNDGCSSECEFEPGYRCIEVAETPAAQISIPVVYRDFRASNFRVGKMCEGGSNAGALCDGDGDCPGSQCSSACGGSEKHCCDLDEPGCASGHPDFQDRPGGGTGMVQDLLDADGKPLRTGSGGGSIASDASFDDWYRDSDRNRTIVTTLPLDSCPGGSCDGATGMCDGGSLDGEDCGTYVFDEPHFYPLTGLGFNSPDAPS